MDKKSAVLHTRTGVVKGLINLPDDFDEHFYDMDAEIAASFEKDDFAKEKELASISRQLMERYHWVYEELAKGPGTEREMKDSGVEWIGKIPVNWETRRLKYVVLRKTDPAEPGSNYIGLENIESFSGNYVKSESSDFKAEGTSLATIPGDVLFGKLRPYLAKCYVVQESGSCSTEFVVMEPLHITASYLQFLLLNPSAIDAINQATYGTKMPRANWETIGNLLIPYIPKYEQEQIANFLSCDCRRINALIANNEAQIEQLRRYKQSLITETVTRGLDPNAPMKHSGVEWIGQIPQSWEIRRVRDIGWTQNGISKSGEFFGSGFPFVSYGDVYRNYALPNIVTGQIESDGKERESYSVQAGDIFFTRTSETIEEVGFSSVCKATIPDAVFAGFLIRLRPYKTESIVSSDYAKYYFRGSHIRGYLTKEMNLVTRASLSQGLLKAMSVLVPPMDEQKAIAEYLDRRVSQIETVITLKQSKIEKLKQYRQSLIYEYVTGKKEVRPEQ